MTPIEILQDVELRDELFHSLELLPHRDKTIVEMIFGIGDFEPTTQVEIAKHFNISAPRVHQETDFSKLPKFGDLFPKEGA